MTCPEKDASIAPSASTHPDSDILARMFDGFAFRYEDWARWNVGSTVTFQSSVRSRIVFTLAAIEADKVILHYVFPDSARASGGVEIRAHPGQLTSERMSFERVPAQDPQAQITTGQEVMELGNEPVLCAWIERPFDLAGHVKFRAKSWYYVGIPGGVLRWQLRSATEDMPRFVWEAVAHEAR